jgi:hypothetical protein
MTTFGNSTTLVRAPVLQSPSLLPAEIHHQSTCYPSLLVLQQAIASDSTPMLTMRKPSYSHNLQPPPSHNFYTVFLPMKDGSSAMSLHNLQQISTIFLKQFAIATSVSIPTIQSKDYLPHTPAVFNPDPTYTPLSPATPNLNQQVLSEQKPMATLAASSTTFFVQPSLSSFPTVISSLYHPPTNTWTI